MTYAQSGGHRRGEMNEKGIYIAAGSDSNNTKIYDMRYYNHSDNKIQLLASFSHSYIVFECFFKNSTSALCCDDDGYIKEYDLTNPHSISSPTVFNKTALSTLRSCMQTKDKKHIIAGSWQKFYILNAEDGSVKNTHIYTENEGVYAYQIAEIRPNIIVTTDWNTASLHNISNTQSVPSPIKFIPDLGEYWAVIALESNLGDFAIGGECFSTQLGFLYILHLGEDNQTITTLRFIDDIPGNGCDIRIIKELKRGIILFGGDGNCEVICLWNYMDIPTQDPQCWNDQTGSFIYDIVGIPY